MQMQESLQLASLTELSQKFAAVDLLADVIAQTLPGCYVPRLRKGAIHTLKVQVSPPVIVDGEVNATLESQFKIFREYVLHLCDFDHILSSAALKIFLEKKSDLREVMTFILKQ